MQSRSLVCGFFLALLIASASCSNNGKSGDVATGQSETSAQSTPGVAASSTGAPGANVKNLGALVDLIVADANDLPRAEFDPGALAESLGKDPQKIFEWVRDRTWWVPYRGMLRGPKGVMLDRVGNSLDRAALLGALLQRAGYTVRLAHAQLPEGRAREILSKIRQLPDQRRDPTPPVAVSVERQRAMETIAPGFADSVKEQVAESQRLFDEADALARAQSDWLVGAIGNMAKPAQHADSKASVAAVQDHWWIEIDDNGQWVAMDVLLPSAKRGETLASASATSEWTPQNESPSIPESDWQAVRVRVVVERYQAGAMSESTALEAVLRPALLLDRQIVLSHLPKPWPDTIADAKTDPNALKNAALWVRSWLPILRVGNDYIAQSAITESGDLTAGSSDSPAGLGSSTGGAFGDALGGGEETPSYATAEWIDYEIVVPGEPTQKLRRTLFDLLGPARRAAHVTNFEVSSDDAKVERFEALWSQTDILLQPCELTPEFVLHLASAGIVASRDKFVRLSQERDSAMLSQLASELLEDVDVWGPLPNVATWRSALNKHPADWFLARPNVLNYRVGQSVAGNESATLRELIDVASNAIEVRAAAGRSPFEIRVRQGVADTVAEAAALGGDLRAVENTISIFPATRRGAGDLVRIAPSGIVAAQGLGWPEDATARLADDLSAGFMAVGPKKPVDIHGRPRVGWWRIDPKTGETIGVMDTGFHQGAPEDAQVRAEVDGLKAFMKRNAGEISRRRRIAGYGSPTKAQIYEADLYKRIANLLKEVAELEKLGRGF